MSFIIELLGEFVLGFLVETLNNPKRPFLLRLFVASVFILFIVLLIITSIQLFYINIFLGIVVVVFLLFFLINIIEAVRKKK